MTTPKEPNTPPIMTLVAGVPFEHRVTAVHDSGHWWVASVEARRADGAGSGSWFILWSSFIKSSESEARSVAERWLVAYRRSASWDRACAEAAR